jgi:hypothetical protein
MAFFPLSALGGMFGIGGSRRRGMPPGAPMSDPGQWLQALQGTAQAAPEATADPAAVDALRQAAQAVQTEPAPDPAAVADVQQLIQGMHTAPTPDPQAVGDVQRVIQGMQTPPPQNPAGIQDVRRLMQGMQTPAPPGMGGGWPQPLMGRAVNPYGAMAGVGGAVNPYGSMYGAMAGGGLVPLSRFAGGGAPSVGLTLQQRLQNLQNRVTPPMAPPYGFGFRPY